MFHQKTEYVNLRKPSTLRVMEEIMHMQKPSGLSFLEMERRPVAGVCILNIPGPGFHCLQIRPKQI